jgi:hypothetical protein
MLFVSIFYLNFNVEVGGQTVISKSVILRALLDFFEIIFPDPWSSFSVASYNELTEFLSKAPFKMRQGLRRFRHNRLPSDFNF